jgi:hypothetical protein
VAEVLRKLAVGVDHHHGGPDESEDYVLAVAGDYIVEDFRFVEDVHVAHIIVELARGSEVGALGGHLNLYLLIVEGGLVLGELVTDGTGGETLEERVLRVKSFGGLDPSYFGT